MSPQASPYLDVPAGSRRLRVAMLVPADRGHLRGLDAVLQDLRAAAFVDLAGVYFFDDGAGDASSLVLRGYRAFDDSVCADPVSPAVIAGKHVNLVELRAALEGESAAGTPLDALLCPVFSAALLSLAHLAREGLWWQGASGALPSHVDYLYDLRSTAMGEAPVGFGIWAAAVADGPPRLLMDASTRQLSSFSVNLNLSSLQPLRRHLWLAALRRLSVGTLGANVREQPPEVARRADDAIDNAFTLTRWIGSMAVRHVGRRIRRRGTTEAWRVGWRPLREGGEAFADPDGYRWLDPPAGNWYADPHLVARAGREWLFLEEYEARTQRGRLVCLELTPDGPAGPAQPVLERPYHLSYPHIVEDGGEIFMIPESGFNDTVELYRAVEFPFRWELVKVLYRGPAFDTTVHKADGRYWFFTSLVEGEHRVAAQLLLFSADRLDGDWQLHPASPLSCDAATARSAGPLFRQGGRLLRPAQDCSVEYGGALRFREITALGEREYEERCAGLVLPGIWPSTIGVHTYGRTSNYEVIDRLERLRAG